MLNGKCLLVRYITEQLFGQPYWIYANTRSTYFSVFNHLINLGSEIQNIFFKLLTKAYVGLII